MYRIGKAFTFEAGHFLAGLPADHKCGRQHGHSYTAEVTVTSAELTAPGFVVDFSDLSPLKEHLADVFDHRNLNDVIAVAPTSENIARAVFDWCTSELVLPPGAYVEAVTIRETSATWARYEPERRSAA